MCLLCEEKAKAIDKVETQESAATAIQALARQALRQSVIAAWMWGQRASEQGGRAARKGTGLEACWIDCTWTKHLV